MDDVKVANLRAVYFNGIKYSDTNGAISKAIKDRYNAKVVIEAVSVTNIDGVPHIHNMGYTPEMFEQDAYNAKMLGYSLEIVRTIYLTPKPTLTK